MAEEFRSKQKRAAKAAKATDDKNKIRKSKPPKSDKNEPSKSRGSNQTPGMKKTGSNQFDTRGSDKSSGKKDGTATDGTKSGDGGPLKR